jgi:hypothetical protein
MTTKSQLITFHAFDYFQALVITQNVRLPSHVMRIIRKYTPRYQAIIVESRTNIHMLDMFTLKSRELTKLPIDKRWKHADGLTSDGKLVFFRFGLDSILRFFKADIDSETVRPWMKIVFSDRIYSFNPNLDIYTESFTVTVMKGEYFDHLIVSLRGYPRYIATIYLCDKKASRLKPFKDICPEGLIAKDFHSSGRYKTITRYSEDELLFSGGDCAGYEKSRSTYLFNAKTMQIVQANDLPCGMSFHSCFPLRDGLFVTGGSVKHRGLLINPWGVQHMCCFYVDRWKPVFLPLPNNRVWVLGGSTFTERCQITEIYDGNTHQVSFGPRLDVSYIGFRAGDVTAAYII